MARRAGKAASVGEIALEKPDAVSTNEPASPAPKLPNVQSPLYRTVYINHVKVPISQWDIGLVVSHLAERPDIGSVIEEQIALKMSPIYFKAFVSALNTALESWEKTFGVIELGLGQRPNRQGVKETFDKLEEILKNNENKN